MNKGEFFLKSDIEEILDRIKDISDDFSGKTILLTGARGFLGRYFVEIFKDRKSTRLNSSH